MQLHHIIKTVTKPQWALEKVYLWSRCIANLKQTDRVFAFYPKTGSTWVRIFLYNHLKNLQGNSSAEFNFDVVDAAMPEFGNRSFFNPWPFEQTQRIVKTHRPYQRFWKSNKNIIFVREPRDTMISFLHYANAKKVLGFSGELNDLIRHPEMGLDAYFNFYMSWLPHADLVVKYEDLRTNPEKEFARILEHCNIDSSKQAIKTSLEASKLENTRAAQNRSTEKFQSKFKEGFVFARKGAIGEGKNLFTAELEEYYQERRRHWGFELYD